jgi:hypothetical protein
MSQPASDYDKDGLTDPGENFKKKTHAPLFFFVGKSLKAVSY